MSDYTATGAAGRMLNLVIKGDPIPTSRPRVTQRGTFIPARSRQAQRRVQQAAEAAGVRFGKSHVVVCCTFYGPRANSDLDNLAKTVLDGLQAAQVFDDDCHVHALQLYRFNGVPKEERRTTIHVYPMP